MTAKQRLIDMNQQVQDQMERIKNMNRLANQNEQQTHNIMRELGDQGDVIRNQVDMNKNIKSQLNKASHKTNEMRRRNICIKLLMYIVILVLFALIVALIIVKVSK